MAFFDTAPSYSPAIAGLKPRRKLAFVKGCLGLEASKALGWGVGGSTCPLVLGAATSFNDASQQISRNHLPIVS